MSESHGQEATAGAPLELVDIRPLKTAAKGLPERDPTRELIEGEPDFLPPSVLAAKADSWVLLLLRVG